MIRRPPRSTQSRSSAASDVYKRQDVYYEVSMADAWVWDMYRPSRFVKSAKILTFRDVSIEEIVHPDFDEVPSE